VTVRSKISPALSLTPFGPRDRFLFATCFPSIQIKAFVGGFRTLPIGDALLPGILCKKPLRAFKLVNEPISEFRHLA
jgi:hypothetical protein